MTETGVPVTILLTADEYAGVRELFVRYDAPLADAALVDAVRTLFLDALERELTQARNDRTWFAPGITYAQADAIIAEATANLAPLAPFWPPNPAHRTNHGTPLNLTWKLARAWAAYHGSAITIPIACGLTEAALCALPQIGALRAAIIRHTIAAARVAGAISILD